MNDFSDHWKDRECISAPVGPGLRLYAVAARDDHFIVGSSYFVKADYIWECSVSITDVFDYFEEKKPDVDFSSYDKKTVMRDINKIYDRLKRIPFFQKEDMSENEVKATWGKILCFQNRRAYEKRKAEQAGGGNE